MEHPKFDRASWLAAAVAGIYFKPDRKSVEAELRGHIEDKTADLMRIFPGMTWEEAEERALAGMGDPKEVSRELAKVHRPWLGYLWRLSQWTLGVLVVLFALHCVTTETSWDSPVWGGYYSRAYTQPAALEPAQGEVGGYTFRILEAVYQDYPEDARYRVDQVKVTFRVSSPRFWERVDPNAAIRHLTLVTQDGTRYPMDQQVQVMMGEGNLEFLAALNGCHQERWGLFYREFAAFGVTDWQEGDRVWLEFDFDAGDLVLSAQLTREVMEQ